MPRHIKKSFIDLVINYRHSTSLMMDNGNRNKNKPLTELYNMVIWNNAIENNWSRNNDNRQGRKNLDGKYKILKTDN